MASTKEKNHRHRPGPVRPAGYDGCPSGTSASRWGSRRAPCTTTSPASRPSSPPLLSHFENRAAEGMAQLEQALGDQQGPWGQVSYRMVCQAFFEGYLMDPFCNQVLRLLQMEQFHNPDLGEIYERWMFGSPWPSRAGCSPPWWTWACSTPPPGRTWRWPSTAPSISLPSGGCSGAPCRRRKGGLPPGRLPPRPAVFPGKGTDAWHPS